MRKVYVTDHDFPSLDGQRSIIESGGFQLEEVKPKCKTEDDIIRTCSEAEVLLVQWAPITRKVLAALNGVKCIVRYGIGVNNVDLQAAKELGVTVANVPDYCLEEVSDHALAMILSLCRRIPQGHHQIAHGGWGVGPLRPIPALTDLTLGIVGFGRIGQRVARKAGVFGFRILGFDPYVQDRQFAELSVEKEDWNVLVKTADVISLHCPLVEGTKHLINRETISLMKKSVILVNASRGPIVNETDLIEALTTGKILAAGLDVFEEEPLPTNSPLRGMGNVILTSHAAAVSEKAVLSCQLMAAETARNFLQGKRPASVIV